MAAVYRASSTTTTNVVSTTVNPTVSPSAVPGDVAIMRWSIAHAAGRTYTDPVGWDPIGTPVVNGVVTYMVREYIKALTSGDIGTSVTGMGTSATANMSVVIDCFSGVNTTSPIDAHSLVLETVAGTTHVVPSITTATDGCLIVEAVGDKGTNPSTFWTAPVTGNAPTKTGSITPTGSGAVSCATGYWSQATHGATSTDTWTGTISTATAFMSSIALVPGGISGDVSATVTASPSAAGSVGRTGGASATVTASRTAAGRIGKVGASTTTVTASATAGGSLGLPGSATRSATATVTAAGVRGTFGASTTTATGTASAAGVAGLGAGASATVTASATAAGAINTSSGASVAAVASATAAASVGKLRGAGFTATATATAAGVVSINVYTGGASSSVTAIISAAGSVAGINLYLFTPPQRTETVVLAGRALRYSYQVSLTVYKTGGHWVAEETPASETLLAAERILAVSGRPQTIDSATALELIADGVGTCSPLT